MTKQKATTEKITALEEAPKERDEEINDYEKAIKAVKLDFASWREFMERQVEQIATLTIEVKNQKKSAARFCRNEEYYCGLLDKVASYLGPGVFVSDDGSVQDGPLRAKVPEMVATLTVENTRLREALKYIAEYWNGNENLMATTDAANMARDTAEEALKMKEAGR